jgi:hypothetical protein
LKCGGRQRARGGKEETERVVYFLVVLECNLEFASELGECSELV